MTTPSIVIRPPKATVDNIAEFKELWKFRHLLFVLVERAIRSRYKNSVLGVAWSVIPQLLSVMVLTVVIGYIMHTGPRNLSAYIFCAMLPWTFFQTSVLDSSASVLQQLGILKKVYIPRELPILSSVMQNFAQFVISFLIFCIYRWGVTTVLHGWPGLPPIQVLYLPAVVVILAAFTVGVSLFVGAANVFYEDVKFIMLLLLSLGFYLVPIMYPAENIYYAARFTPQVAHLIYHVYLLNPVAWSVEAFRQMFFGVYNMAPPGSPVQMTAMFDPRFMLIDGIESLIILYLGYGFFNKMKWKFTERP